MSSGFNISLYQNDLKSKIQKYGSDLSSAKNFGSSNPVSGNGMNLSSTQRSQLAKSAFLVTAGTDNNNTTSAAQNNKTQKQGSNAATTFSQFIVKTANDAVNFFTNAIKTLEAKLNSITGADASALASKPTSGNNVKPQDNMQTDNQGAKKDSTQPKDSQKPNVTFGEEKVADNTDNKTTDTTKTNKKENTKNTDEAKSSSELDKAAIKEEQKQYETAQKKLDTEAQRIEQAMSQQAA